MSMEIENKRSWVELSLEERQTILANIAED